MAPEARLLLIERIIGPEHGPASALLDITVFVNAGAGGRTEAEYHGGSAGVALARCTTAGHPCLMRTLTSRREGIV
jgi:hypothetical protein